MEAPTFVDDVYLGSWSNFPPLIPKNSLVVIKNRSASVKVNPISRLLTSNTHTGARTPGDAGTHGWRVSDGYTDEYSYV